MPDGYCLSLMCPVLLDHYSFTLLGGRISKQVVHENDAIENRAKEEGSLDTQETPPSTIKLVSGQKAVFQWCYGRF